MKVLLLISIFIFTFFNSFAEDKIKVKNKKDEQNLFLGVGFGVTSISSNQVDVVSTRYPDVSPSPDASITLDFLNEINVFIEAKLDSKFKVGAELGTMTYFQNITGASGFSELEFSIQNDYISGAYFSPYFAYNNLKLGFTYMSPSASTYKGDSFVYEQIVTYDNFPSEMRETFDSILRDYMNIYIGYGTILEKDLEFPIRIYTKIGYDLQNPFNYEKIENLKLKSNTRFFMTLGFNVSFGLD